MQSEPLTERKLNRSTLSMPNALSCRMTGAKLVRCISGTVEAGSFSKSSSGERSRGNKKHRVEMTKSDRKTGREGGGRRTRLQHFATDVNNVCIHLIFSSSSFCSFKLSHTRVQPEAFPRSVSPSSPSPLAGWSLGDGSNHQRFYGSARIIGPQLHKRTVDDKYNAIYGDGGLSYVSGHHNLEEANRKESQSFWILH